jgi:outer membrane protein assembly factor BamB
MTADPETNRVYALSTAGHLLCLDAKTGKLIWQRQLTEELGRVTGYGGRISSPIFDSGLVVVSVINGSWGDQARASNRFHAFDGTTGEIVWSASPEIELNQSSIRLRGTYYSNPVVCNVNGQRELVCGSADGCIHGLKLRTGELLWSYHMSAGVVNPSPVVDGNLVYICHGEENPGGGSLGRVVCLDMSVVKDKKPKVVWEKKNLGRRLGLASPALWDGKLFMPEDGGELYCFDCKTGKQLWKYNFGTVARGAPLICDGKCYIFEVLGKMSVIKLGDEEPDSDEEVYTYRFRPRSGVGQIETNGTPIAVNGRLYFQTLDDTYCVGKADAKATGNPTPKFGEETPFDANAKPAQVMLYPADVSTKAGATVKFEVRYVDSNGRVVKIPADAKAEWSLPLPPKTPTGAQPPALKAVAMGDAAMGTLTLDATPNQQGYVSVKVGDLTARARVRVVNTIPMKQDFSKVPVGGVPGAWVNTSAKFKVEELMLGGKMEKVLSKVNNDPRPPIARANAYITQPESSNYTIQADIYCGEVKDQLPDGGVGAHRYVLYLDGKADLTTKKRQLRLVSWEARNRVNEAVEFDWQKDTWYTVKLKAEVDGDKVTMRGKAWPRGTEEPKEWQLNFTDPYPNKEGAATLYGYVSNATQGETEVIPGSPVYYQNVIITPNTK